MNDRLCSWDEAVALLKHVRLALAQETTPLEQAIRRTLAEPAVAQSDYPRFRSSAMDGWALQEEDLRDGRQELVIAGEILAGDAPRPFSRGNTVAVMTGAPLPVEAAGVVPVEYARDVEGRLHWDTHVATTHIREQGEDFRLGQVLLEAGSNIGPTQAMLLAAAGVKTCRVYARAEVALLKSGNEIAAEPGPYGIFDGTTIGLRHMIEQAGARIRVEMAMKDELSEVVRSIDQQLAADVNLIITTGGVSKGVADFIPQAVKMLGGTIHLHRLAIKPSKPLLVATFVNGAVLVGLPGNPVSQLVAFAIAVLPLLQGRSPLALKTTQASLGGDAHGKTKMLTFLRAVLTLEHTMLMAQVLPGQESFRVSNLVTANGWVLAHGPLRAGDHVSVLPFPYMKDML